MLIDTHAHLTSDLLVGSTKQILARAQANKVVKIVNICTDEKSLIEGIALGEKTSWIYNAAATTPHDVDVEGESFFPSVELAAYNKQLIAIGETGLDYHYERSSKDNQQKHLQRYVDLSLKTRLPIIFHCRNAFADLFSIVKQPVSAVLHCFTGSLEEAKKVLERGWYLSISGIITFKKSQELQDVVKYAPLEQLFLETDSPYLAPAPYRGQINEPCFLPEIAKMVASLKQISAEEVAMQTAKNAKKFFVF
jgi:TatD DNase family protein